MLIAEIFRYLKRRADKRRVYLKNFVDQGHHHGSRISEPIVEIIIPTRDKFELLHACIESVINKTTYKNYSITIVNNQSIEAETLSYLAKLQSKGVKIIDYPHKFNYSAICNLAAEKSSAEYLCFLNNDTEVIEPNWLSFMVDHAIQPGVGVVGSKLLYPDGTVQHLGVTIGLNGLATHAFSGMKPDQQPLQALASSCFEVTANTFACAVVSTDSYRNLGGLAKVFKFGLNDVEYSLRARLSGQRNVMCSQSCLTHSESATRGRVTASPRSFLRAVFEVSVLLVKFKGVSIRDTLFDLESKIDRHQAFFLHQTMNNVGHSLIELGLEKTMSQLPNKLRIKALYSWRKPGLLARLGHKAGDSVLVSSSNLIQLSEKHFDEQGLMWSANFSRHLKQMAGEAKVLNLGINGIVGEKFDSSNLSDSSLTQIDALREKRFISIWARGETSASALRGLGFEEVVALGCPTFSLLNRPIDNFEKALDPKKVLLSGAASSISHLLFPLEDYPKLKFLVIPQSSQEEIHDHLDPRSREIYRPISLDSWSKHIQKSEVDLYLGTRLHGGVLALALGIPAVIVSGDLRTNELKQLSVALPHLSSFDSFTIDSVASLTQNFNENLSKLDDIVNRQKKFLMARTDLGGK